MKLQILFSFCLITFVSINISSGQKIIEVGPGKTYSNPQLALQVAKPGDTVLMYPSVYSGDYFIQNLKGSRNARITLKGVNADQVIIEGAQAFQFSEIEFVNLQDFSLRGQSANGLNLDDGGTYDTPAKNVQISNIRFLKMNATGNNDMLKLSGLDSFEVLNCHFFDGSPGGSGIDMVGCHYGIIRQCSFTNQGNSIQCKGGSRFLRIEQNLFSNGGDRTLNLGGSTGAPFFRPVQANYEASDILVSSNHFQGSQAPIAYVGCRRVQVSNNTFYNPTKWIIRILQESADTSFYQSCANNIFSNNLIYASSIDPTINIGPYTSEKTFQFQNNLWFSSRNQNWKGPTLPVTESNGLYAINPMLEDIVNGNVRPTKNSPVIGKGKFYSEINTDFYKQSFKNPPSIGCSEYINTTYTVDNNVIPLLLFPNPASEFIHLDNVEEDCLIQILNLWNQVLYFGKIESNTLDISHYPPGIYRLRLITSNLPLRVLQFEKY